VDLRLQRLCYVQSGNRITGGGISSVSTKRSLYIVAVLLGVETAREGQRAAQYYPQPALHAGDPGDGDIRDNPGMDNPGMVPALPDRWEVAAARDAVTKWLHSV
jgi:hypothetical protein